MAWDDTEEKGNANRKKDSGSRKEGSYTRTTGTRSGGGGIRTLSTAGAAEEEEETDGGSLWREVWEEVINGWTETERAKAKDREMLYDATKRAAESVKNGLKSAGRGILDGLNDAAQSRMRSNDKIRDAQKENAKRAGERIRDVLQTIDDGWIKEGSGYDKYGNYRESEYDKASGILTYCTYVKGENLSNYIDELIQTVDDMSEIAEWEALAYGLLTDAVSSLAGVPPAASLLVGTVEGGLEMSDGTKKRNEEEIRELLRLEGRGEAVCIYVFIDNKGDYRIRVSEWDEE